MSKTAPGRRAGFGPDAATLSARDGGTINFALDANSLAQAQLNAPGQLTLNVVGVVMHFAFASNNPWDHLSNPAAIKFVD